MESYTINNFSITLNIMGSKKYQKVSYPVRFGAYSIIETPNYIYHFNLNGNIKHIQSKDIDWPKDEWIKRTEGNDWIYYTPGIYTGLQSYIGEYYLPCFSYKSNSIFAYDPFVNNSVPLAIKSLDDLPIKIAELNNKTIPQEIKEFLGRAALNSSEKLKLKADKLHGIIGGRATVLPPDSRHVDYDVIPLTIADGCLYKCKFCMIKTMENFKTRSKENILNQVRELKDFYGENISNYNSVFFGQHDALGAGKETILFSAERAYDAFGIEDSTMHGANLFIFGSVDSFLDSNDSLFKELNSTPYYTYINIGLESAEEETLNILNKPVPINAIQDAYFKMLDVNKNYDKIEVTANFILSNNLPERHFPSIVDLINSKQEKFYSKGGVYFSPLNKKENKIALQKKFIEIKNKVRVPAYIYLIQRL